MLDIVASSKYRSQTTSGSTSYGGFRHSFGRTPCLWQPAGHQPCSGWHWLSSKKESVVSVRNKQEEALYSTDRSLVDGCLNGLLWLVLAVVGVQSKAIRQQTSASKRRIPVLHSGHTHKKKVKIVCRTRVYRKCGAIYHRPHIRSRRYRCVPYAE